MKRWNTTQWIFCLVLLFGNLYAATPVRITVNAGAKHTFQGLGGNYHVWNMDTCFNALSPQMQDSVARMIWEDCNFRILRLGDDPLSGTNDADNLALKYKKVYDVAKSIRPDMIFLFSSWEDPTCPIDIIGWDSFTERRAQALKELKENYGMTFDAIGLYNEPGCPLRYNEVTLDPSEWKTAEYTREAYDTSVYAPAVISLRRHLDDRGLEDVKIIATEMANVDGHAFSSFQALMNSQEAMDALDGFAYHSYGMSTTKAMRDFIAPYGKEVWQTESSENGSEELGDSVQASKCALRFMSDVNLGVTHWLHFLAYHNVRRPDDIKTRILGYDYPNEGDITVLQKYYYYKQLGNTFEPGAVIRTSTSDMPGGTRYEYMEYTYGARPGLYALCGFNPDGSVGLGTTNFSIEQDSSWMVWRGDTLLVSTTPPAQTYDVTFYVEELKDIDSVVFSVRRSSGTLCDTPEGTVTMRNGEVHVSVEPSQLVTLRSAPAVTAANERVSGAKVPHQPSLTYRCKDGTMILRATPGADMENAFALPHASCFNIQGRLIASVPAMQSNDGGIVWQVNEWTSIAKGAYIVRVPGMKDLFVVRR